MYSRAQSAAEEVDQEGEYQKTQIGSEEQRRTSLSANSNMSHGVHKFYAVLVWTSRFSTPSSAVSNTSPACSRTTLMTSSENSLKQLQTTLQTPLSGTGRPTRRFLVHSMTSTPRLTFPAKRQLILTTSG